MPTLDELDNDHVPVPLEHTPDTRGFVEGDRIVIGEGDSRDALQVSGAWVRGPRVEVEK